MPGISITALPSLTKLMPVDSATTSNTALSSEGHLDNFISQAYHQLSQQDAQYKNAINALSAPQMTSDPNMLAQLQVRLGEYSNYISLVTTLARKSVSTVETLEKAQ
ncbi:type III secretion system inner rod subunit SctI [Enterobacter sp. 22466]|uniref:type III secretion system inner rod subunit SctI n=1 Tax=Enterobacter sp. 22466 TaxID=3453924 RepID=UPI003F865E89